MKKSILYIILMALSGTAVTQETSLSVYNSCVTAAKICLDKQITTEATPSQALCLGSIQPQYFKFNMAASGNIILNTYGHTGTYALYGPITALGISACQQISLGQVANATGSLSGSISIPHGQGYYVLKVSPTN